MTTEQHTGRRVVANISLSMDGRVNGAAGDHDMGWIVPHALSDAAREHMVRVTGTATTALLGRKNFEGFGGFWPAVADDENADPRDRAFSSWLNGTEKIVFTHTPTDASWANTRMTDVEPAKEVAQLRDQDGGDIVVLASGSVIRALLAADEVDRLSITLCPSVVGGGTPLFEDGVPASDWSLVDVTTSASGALCLLYDRVRGD
ncbi:dihydrofolate reductase family protein [Actinomycetes bacterium KLBMP 9759]